MCANVVIIIMTKLFGGAQIGHYFMEDFPLLFCYINHKRGKVKNVFILNFTAVGEPHCCNPEKNEGMGEKGRGGAKIQNLSKIPRRFT